MISSSQGDPLATVLLLLGQVQGRGWVDGAQCWVSQRGQERHFPPGHSLSVHSCTCSLNDTGASSNASP